MEKKKSESEGVYFLEYKEQVRKLFMKYDIGRLNTFNLDRSFVQLFIEDKFYASEDFS